MTIQITEPIEFYKVDNYVPITMFAPALEGKHDSYSIMDLDCEFGKAYFININPAFQEVMHVGEIRQLILDALVAYAELVGLPAEEQSACLAHYINQAEPVVNAASFVQEHQS